MSLLKFLTLLKEYVLAHERKEPFGIRLGWHRRDSFGVLTKEPLFGESLRFLVEVPLLQVVDQRNVVDPLAIGAEEHMPVELTLSHTLRS